MFSLEENFRTQRCTQMCAMILLISFWTSAVTSLSIYGPGYDTKDSEAPLELKIDFSIIPNIERDSIEVPPITVDMPEQRRQHDRQQHNRQHHNRQHLRRISQPLRRPLNLERSQVAAVHKRTSLGEVLAVLNRRFGRGSQENAIQPVGVRFGLGGGKR